MASLDRAGFGVLMHHLGGGSPHSASEYYGRTIVDAQVTGDNDLRLTFDDGITIRVFDDGQSCCEDRYMTCDDDAADLIGHKLVGITVKHADADETDYGEHEVCFLEIQTDLGGFITVANHNEHNGYYGGFGLSIEEVAPRRLW